MKKILMISALSLIAFSAMGADKDLSSSNTYQRNPYPSAGPAWSTLEQAGLLWYTEQDALKKCFQAGGAECRIFSSSVTGCNYTTTNVFIQYCSTTATARGKFQ